MTYWFLMAFYITIRNSLSLVGFDPLTLGFEAQVHYHLGHRGKVDYYLFYLAHILILASRICLGI